MINPFHEMRRQVHIVFYSTTDGEAEKKLMKLVSALVPEKDLESVDSLGRLKNILRRPCIEQTVAILIASTGKELQELRELSELLSFVRLIIIAPDENKETIDLAYKLHPRYLSFYDSDFSDVAGVVGKMISRQDSGARRPLGKRHLEAKKKFYHLLKPYRTDAFRRRSSCLVIKLQELGRSRSIRGERLPGNGE